jgi:hypothetical protein
MFKILAKIIGIVPIYALTFPLEIVVYSLRFLITGKPFPKAPMYWRFLFEW